MTNTTQKPTFEEMIPWAGGECPWDGLVYFTTSSNKEVVKKLHSKDLKWNHVGYADIIAYMPVQLWEEGYRRPKDFIGENLFEGVCLEDLFGLYQDYKREKESAENMMAKVIQEIEYRTPDEWNIELKKQEEDPSKNPEEAFINDWQDWDKGDTLKCVFSGGNQSFSEGMCYEVIDYDEDDQYKPILLASNGVTHFWPSLIEYRFVKVSPEAEA